MHPFVRGAALWLTLAQATITWAGLAIVSTHLSDGASLHRHEAAAAGALAVVHGHSHAPDTPSHHHEAEPGLGAPALAGARSRQEAASVAPSVAVPEPLSEVLRTAAPGAARHDGAEPRAREGPHRIYVLRTLLI